MPIFKTFNLNDHTTVLVWKISESLHELEGILLTDSSKSRLAKMRTANHQKGFLSVRHLLKQAGYTDNDLHYDVNGKPHLSDGKHISISHSFSFAAVVVSDHEVGIDIEKNADKIQRIAHKFVGSEWEFLEETPSIEALMVVWGAKEALYKIVSTPGLSFKEQIHISPFSLEDGRTRGCVQKNGVDINFSVFFEVLENYTMVVASAT